MAGLLGYPDGAAFGVGSPAETAEQPSGLAGLLGGAYEALGLLAKKALGSSEMMRQTGVYNPAPMVEAAMLPMGTGAIAGLKMVPGEMALGAGPIRAYHGSPHDFDKFDLSKIGTGEGAQAYGHGLYFAEKEGTAKAYRERLSGRPQLDSGADPFKDMSWLSNEQKGLIKWQLNEAEKLGLTGDEAVKYANQKFTDMGNSGNPHMRQAYYDAANAVMELRGKNWGASPGRMYEVNINADPAHFLDWDKPLSGQPKAVQDWYNSRVAPGLKTREIGNNPNLGPLTDVIHPEGGSLGTFTKEQLPEVLSNPAKYVPTTGMDVVRNTARPSYPIRDNPQSPWKASNANSYEEALAMVGGDKSRVNKMLTPDPNYTSQTLREAGIPGIKYLDQGSRGAGEGSRNYVVFDDKLIDILKKYGLAGMLAAPPAFDMATRDR